MQDDPTVFFVITLGGYGLYLSIKAFRAYRKKSASKSWPETIGTIHSSGIGREIVGFKGHTREWVYFNFSYTVLGAEYKGVFEFHGFWDTKIDAIISQHPEGSTLSVRYNPKKPSEFVTEHDKIGIVF